jgi:hypothetical protein
MGSIVASLLTGQSEIEETLRVARKGKRLRETLVWATSP